MSLATLDTHEVVKELKAAGFTEDQAEAVTRVVRRAQDLDLSSLATKANVFETKTEILQTKMELIKLIAETKRELVKSIAETKTELLETKAELTKAIVETKSELLETKTELIKLIGDTKAEINRWLLGSVGLQTIVIIGAVIALVRSMLK